MLNHITIMGRMTRDPELRYTQSQVPVTSFTVACERDFTPQNGERETDFIDCVVWRKSAEFVNRYFRKGSMIVVDGRLESRKWTDRDGNKRTSWEIAVNSVYFGEGKKDDDRRAEVAAPYGGTGKPVSVAPPAFDGFEDLGPGTGEDNPFVSAQQTSLDDGELPV